MFHNEALQMLDMVVAAAVEDQPANQPPATPVAGNCYIVGPVPTGAWAGHAGSLASYSAAGWRFIAPKEGLPAWVKSLAVFAFYRANEWEVGKVRGSGLILGGQQVVGAQAAAIPNPTGGSNVDSPARTAVAAILATLRQHGLIAT